MATATYADDIEEEETFPCAVPQNQESSGLSRSPCDVCALPVTLPVSVGGVRFDHLFPLLLLLAVARC